jgi:hypothetical protein
MADVNAALAGIRTSFDDLIAAGERCRDTWHTPRAPGKWSPSQVVEHVALALEDSANVVSGTPSEFPAVPRVLRSLVRNFVFNRALKKGAFPNGITTRAFTPSRAPETPAQARLRLDSVLVRFAEACRRRAAAGLKVDSHIFGQVPLEDYVRFQELHTRHHCKQMPATTR